MNQTRFPEWIRIAGMLFALFLALCASTARAEVRLPNREFTTSIEDLRVKVLGGAVLINRSWTTGQWYLNPAWADLKLSYGIIDGSVQMISRTNADFVRTGNGYYIFDNRFFIRAIATGWQWYDQFGNTIDYDARGKIQGYADRNGIRVSFTYDAAGNKSTVLDHYGNIVLRFTWADGKVASVADNTGRTVRYQYTGDNLTQVTDVLGNASSYTYDGNGQILTLTDAENRTTRIVYALSVPAVVLPNASASGDAGLAAKGAGDARSTNWINGVQPTQTNCTPAGVCTTSSKAAVVGGILSRVASVTDPLGNTTSYEAKWDRVATKYKLTISTPAGKLVTSLYDSRGKLLEQAIGSRLVYELKTDIHNTETSYDERGLATRVQYDSRRNPLTTWYPDGTRKTTTWDSVYSNPLQVTDEAGIQTKYEYDNKGNLLTLTEAVGLPEQRVTTNTYDQYKQHLTHTKKGSSSADDATITWTYDSNGNVASVTDPVGNQTAYTYDVMGNVLTEKDGRGNTATYTYNAAGWRTGMTDALSHTTSYGYDKVGNRITVTDAKNHVTQYAYDKNNRVTQITDALGGTARFEYNADSQNTRRTDQNGVTAAYEYDADGRLIKTTDGNGNVTGNEYGAAGSGLDGLLTAVNFPTYRTEYKYNQSNRHTQMTQILDADIRYINAMGYDATGNLISQSDAADRTTLNKYDALKRLIQAIDPIGGFTRYTYDTRDNLLSVTDASGNTTHYAYDRANRRVSETRPAGGITRYVWDVANNLVIRTDAKGQQRKYSYDAANRRTQEMHYSMVNGVLATTPGQLISTSYDERNQITGYDDGNTRAVYTWDALGRKTAETVNYGSFSKTLSTTWYPNGLKKSFTYADGTSVSYTYDANNQVKTIVTPSGPISHDSYKWNKATQVSTPGATRTLTFDPLLRTTGIKLEKGQAGSGQVLLDYRYTLNAVSEILKKQTQDGIYTYDYDKLARLIQATPPASLQAGPVGLPVEQYTWDRVHSRLSSAQQPGPWDYNQDNQLLSYGQGQQKVTVQYDANGHRIREAKNGQDTTWRYNVAERLTEVADATGNPIASYIYDPFGRRIKKVANGQTTYYQYSNEGLVAEYDGTGVVIQTYGWLPVGTWGGTSTVQA